MVELIVAIVLLFLFRFAGNRQAFDEDIDDYLMIDYLADGELDGDIVDD
jgi:hypothetical protein